MKFYRCQTDVGPQLVHLQAEAKKIDPNFETVEIDFAKQPMMDMLNDLMRRAHVAEGGTEGPADVSRPAPPKPGDVGSFAEGNEPRHNHPWHGNDDLVRAGRACDVCMTREEIAKWRASGDASIEIEDLVLRVTNIRHLENIETLILDQKDGLKKRN